MTERIIYQADKSQDTSPPPQKGPPGDSPASNRAADKAARKEAIDS
jgi:hypothetical protein